MSQKIQVDIDEVMKLYILMEDLVAFFHQPMHYETIEDLHKFLGNRDEGAIKEMAEAYYDVIWNWLPEDKRKEIEER